MDATRALLGQVALVENNLIKRRPSTKSTNEAPGALDEDGRVFPAADEGEDDVRDPWGRHNRDGVD